MIFYLIFFQAEAHPSPQITWFKETYDTDSTEPTLVQIHHEPTKNDKQTQTIDVFGDFFQQVLIDYWNNYLASTFEI